MRDIITGLLLVLVSLNAQAHGELETPILPDMDFPKVKIETSMGDVVVELDRYKAPITVNNFLRYVVNNHYDDTLIHRVVAGFVVQGGGYNRELEELPAFPPIYNESGNGRKNSQYTIAMARQADPHSANRQFYFNMSDNESLDPGRGWGYTVFGDVVEGFEVLDAIAEVEVDVEPKYGWMDVPTTPIIIKRATVILKD